MIYVFELFAIDADDRRVPLEAAKYRLKRKDLARACAVDDGQHAL